MKKDFRILYMGTPSFAVPVLDMLLKHGFHICAVVTAPDKPAGRGQHIRFSPVKNYALAHRLPLLQPERLSDPEFIETLHALHPDLGVVVAFRMLPQSVWSIPPKGTINLHASLLPAYRGAAPINWAIINGETVTGITTFFIDQGLDTGKVIYQQEVPIEPEMDAGALHDVLMQDGAELVLKTVRDIENDTITAFTQPQRVASLPTAPKISRQDCQIFWNKTVNEIHNHVRGLSPSPGAWTKLVNEDRESVNMKIFKGKPEMLDGHKGGPGRILLLKDRLLIRCLDGWYEVLEAQWPGKKRMPVKDLLRGNAIDVSWKIG